jgi:hypothetical protein
MGAIRKAQGVAQPAVPLFQVVAMLAIGESRGLTNQRKQMLLV